MVVGQLFIVLRSKSCLLPRLVRLSSPYIYAILVSTHTQYSTVAYSTKQPSKRLFLSMLYLDSYLYGLLSSILLIHCALFFFTLSFTKLLAPTILSYSCHIQALWLYSLS